jgi:hypothetical protein
MSDLYLACLAITAVAVGLFLLTLFGIRKLSARLCDGVALVVVAVLFFYIFELWYDVRVSDWFPTSSLIILSNWLPILAAVLAAVVWRRAEGSKPRQWIYAGGLLVSGGYAMVHPLLGSPPECGERWDRLGTCLQTTDNTCSPACAATLLKHYGIATTEREMAELCLTREGTSWQGLYRGLKLKTAGTRYDVEVRRCSSGTLRQLAGEPMILSVGLEAGSTVDREFTREFGWEPGVNHSVVLVGFSSTGNAIIADPSQELCREHWDRETLDTLWRGYAFRLVERK